MVSKLNKMETGIGTDIVEIERFSNLIKRKQFLKKIFSKKELNYCFSKEKPSQHLAARFAGKEAIVKALACLNKKVYYDEIEILNRKNNAPFVNIKKYSMAEVRISLSHSRNCALAFAIAIKKQ